MGKWLEYIRYYLKIFFIMLGVYYIVNEHESWNSLVKDNNMQFAFVMTIVFMLINMFRKHNAKTGE